MTKLVYDIEPATPTMIASLDRHCRIREPDGTSDIDPDRAHLNRTIIGSDDGLMASLNAFYDGGVARPAKQSESPYLRIVVSASPAFFRPDDPAASGTWDDDRLELWLDAIMAQLRKEHGDDLVHVELHLDEVTPHIHAVVAPTYQKKRRRPGKKKRNETDEDFALRKLMAETAPTQRTVGRASHAKLSARDSFKTLREGMADAVAHLGIQYGDPLSQDDPAPKTTRQWVKEEAAKVRAESRQLETEAKALAIKANNLNAVEDELDRRERDLDQREVQVRAAQRSIIELASLLSKCGKMICAALRIKAKDDIVEMIHQIEAEADKLPAFEEDSLSM